MMIISAIISVIFTFLVVGFIVYYLGVLSAKTFKMGYDWKLKDLVLKMLKQIDDKDFLKEIEACAYKRFIDIRNQEVGGK